MTRPRVPVALVGLVFLLAACGGTSSPVEAVPEYAHSLSSLDAAVSSGHYQQARLAIRDLRALTGKARSAGDLTQREADQILAAVALVSKDLRDLQPARATQKPGSSPTPSEGEVDSDTQEQNADQGSTSHGPSNEGHGNSENAPGHN
jgi:hypothetical protein